MFSALTDIGNEVRQQREMSCESESALAATFLGKELE